MKIMKKGVTSPTGFKAQGIWCGIKRSRKPDLALIVSEEPCHAAAVYTKNSVKAAPLLVCQKHLKNSTAQAVIVNSGNANCFTGAFGYKYAEQTTALVAEELGIPQKDVLVASTGIIGKPLPFEKIKAGIPVLAKTLKKSGAKNTAKAILTTDLTTKEISVEIRVAGKKVTLGACAKGSGMIAPNMATMLAFITTDAAISPKMLKAALKQACDQSFNCITVDGCMSTNDMVTLMSNGLAKNKTITKPGKDFNAFCKALNHICLDLAKKIVLDGEGATKFIEVNIRGAKTKKQAKDAALVIANSNLVKTAAYGSNPNWGRVAGAVGSLGIKNITEKTLKISFSPFQKKDIQINVNLNIGQHGATAYTCDLSKEYVAINGRYN